MQTFTDIAAFIGCTFAAITCAMAKKGAKKGIVKNTWKIKGCDSTGIVERLGWMIKVLDGKGFHDMEGNLVEKLFMPAYKQVATVIGFSTSAITYSLRKSGAKKVLYRKLGNQGMGLD